NSDNNTAAIAVKTTASAATFTNTPPEAELRYTFTQWQGTHYIDIYRIADHHIQLMASNSQVMTILQSHSNERPLPLSLSWSGTSCITRMTYSIIMTNRVINHHEG
ncbi:MAG: hypothetical protein AB8W32_01235, partial [Arsenophonus endosymbiont of Dermacentor nuttalli]